MKNVQSWSKLHRVMRENGLELRERGNGLVIVASDGTRVKASTVDRELSKPNLIARLGLFKTQPERHEQIQVSRGYRKDPVPMRINTVELYARYQNEQKNLTAIRAEALARARRRKDRAIEDCKRSHRLRRAVIKIVDGKGINKKMLYSQTATALRTKLDPIHKGYAKERKRIYQGFQ